MGVPCPDPHPKINTEAGKQTKGHSFSNVFLNFKFYLLRNNFMYWIAPLSKVGRYFLKCNLQTLLQTFWERLFASKISLRSFKNVIASLPSDWRGSSPALLGCQELSEDTLGCHPWMACGRVDDGHSTRAPRALGCSSIGRKHLELGPAQGMRLWLIPVYGDTSVFLSGLFLPEAKIFGNKIGLGQRDKYKLLSWSST